MKETLGNIFKAQMWVLNNPAITINIKDRKHKNHFNEPRKYDLLKKWSPCTSMIMKNLPLVDEKHISLDLQTWLPNPKLSWANFRRKQLIDLIFLQSE